MFCDYIYIYIWGFTYCSFWSVSAQPVHFLKDWNWTLILHHSGSHLEARNEQCPLLCDFAMDSEDLMPFPVIFLLPMMLGSLCTICLQCCWSRYLPKCSMWPSKNLTNTRTNLTTSDAELEKGTTGKQRRFQGNDGAISSSLEYIYVSSTGHCAHKDPACCGMKCPEKVKLCSKCFKWLMTFSCPDRKNAADILLVWPGNCPELPSCHHFWPGSHWDCLGQFAIFDKTVSSNSGFMIKFKQALSTPFTSSLCCPCWREVCCHFRVFPLTQEA